MSRLPARSRPVAVALVPFGSGLLAENRIVTTVVGSETRARISRLPSTIYLVIEGQIALDARPITQMAAVDNPTRLPGSLLRHRSSARDEPGVQVVAHAGDSILIFRMTQ